MLAQLLVRVPAADSGHPGWQLASALVTYERSLVAARTALERLADSLESPETPGGDPLLPDRERDDAVVTVMFHLGTIGRRMADEALLATIADRLAPLAARRHPRAIAVRASVRGFLAQIHGRCDEGLEAFVDVDHGAISPEQSAHVLLMTGNLHLLDARPERAAALYREASRRSPTVRLLADELGATAQWVAGDLEGAIEVERRCLDLAERAGLISRAAQFRAMLAAMLAMVGRMDEARAVLDEQPVELGTRAADGETRALTLLALGIISLDAGDRTQAVDFLRRIDEPDGHLQRALFLPAASVTALVPERAEAWAAIPARLVRQAVALVRDGSRAAPRAAGTGDAVDASRVGALVPAVLRASKDAAPSGPAGAATVRVSMLGPVRLEPVADPAPWRRSRVREVLAAIAILGPIPREQLAELLWPDQPEGVAGRNLRVNLSYLTDAVEPNRTRRGVASVLEVRGTTLALSAAAAWLDLSAFDDCRSRARAAEQHNDPAGALAALAEGIALWRGEVAADLDAEWLADTRHQRRAQYVAMANRAGELALGQGEIEAALGYADRVVALDAAHERALRLRAAALLALGDRTAAIVALRTCLERCEESGIEPEAETVLLGTKLGVL